MRQTQRPFSIEIESMSWTDLHCRSAFSFLRAAATPEALAAVAASLEIPAIGLCDRDGVYGSVRMHTSAREHGIRAHVGAELTMTDGSVVPVLVQSREGYQSLCRLITTAKLRAPKGEGSIAWEELAEASAGMHALTGDEEGPVVSSWRKKGAPGAAE